MRADGQTFGLNPAFSKGRCVVCSGVTGWDVTAVNRRGKLTPYRRPMLTPHVDDQHLDRPALAGVAEGEPGAGDGGSSALALRAVFEAPGLVASFDDLAVMGEPVEQRSGHLGVAEHGRPLAEREVGGDDDRCALVKPADQME